MVKVLITGGTGLLGKALVETNRKAAISSIYLGAYDMANDRKSAYYKTDICDKDAMDEVFSKAEPQVVIHTAGIANVDYCEKNYKEAYESNVIGTGIIVDLARKTGAKIVFISTNAVFDGRSAPYSENSVTSPINSYGKMKLEAEEMVRDSGLKNLIIRPILMYGWNHEQERVNAVTWLIEKLKKGEKVNMVNDVYENPLFNISCAEIIWSLIDSGKEGIYHLAGRDMVNRYEFARMIADVFDLDKKLISQVSSGFFPGLAPRPRNTSYDTSKIEKDLGLKPAGLKEGLEIMKGMRR
ncbi:MAG: SDR family oxidoreductase [Candidatus Omnitrophica bacterium]|nr:SDR family oxidoreductase [Candidatus Omnitrophota bacterium]MDD5436314.1 SDR family oxidoreductase [Candidatus Omnitrophota bacterium]